MSNPNVHETVNTRLVESLVQTIQSLSAAERALLEAKLFGKSIEQSCSQARQGLANLEFEDGDEFADEIDKIVQERRRGFPEPN